MGIAEQNLIGVAAGLCNLGFLPVVYTISNFLIHRCLEQIRDDVVLHENKVILLGRLRASTMRRLGRLIISSTSGAC